MCYVYSASEHPTGTIPLYEYLYKIKPTSDKVKSYYTTDWNELGQGNEYYKYRRIACYVYALDSKPSNSIPLYSFSRYYEKVLRPYHFFIDLNEAIIIKIMVLEIVQEGIQEAIEIREVAFFWQFSQ